MLLSNMYLKFSAKKIDDCCDAMIMKQILYCGRVKMQIMYFVDLTIHVQFWYLMNLVNDCNVNYFFTLMYW